MTASCRKPGCGRTGSVTISYDAVACQVWIDPLPEVPSGGQVMCDRHIASLRPPRGWVVVDRRDAQSAIVATPEASNGDTVKVARPLRRRWGQFDEPRLEFSSDASARPVILDLPDGRPEPATRPTLAPAALADDLMDPSVDVDHATDPAPVDDVSEERPVGIEQGGEPVDDLTDLLQPKGRLLAKAFDATGEQKSVLTVGAPSRPKPT